MMELDEIDRIVTKDENISYIITYLRTFELILTKHLLQFDSTKYPHYFIKYWLTCDIEHHSVSL